MDLGHAPPSNAYRHPEQRHEPELTFPLRVLLCTNCFLLQTEDFAKREELFKDDYAYFSSTSQTWLAHAAAYAEMITERLGLGLDSQVIEVASNDGYLLRSFNELGIPNLGVEPTSSTAAVARSSGIEVVEDFFGSRLAAGLPKADLIVGNNVFAHVPDINDFASGLAACLKPNGAITLEFPHVLNLVRLNQFDTVYHEHFSYLSLMTTERILHSAGLRIFDAEELDTHGGSLRVYGCLAETRHPESERLRALRSIETEAGIGDEAFYAGFQAKAVKVKNDLLRFLLDVNAEGKSIAAYGAAAKGNTLLNFGGVKRDLLPRVCDAAEAKIGKLMPGSHIPILAPESLRSERPDYLLILPWNIASEIRESLAELARAGTRFVTAVPSLEISG